LCEVFCQCIFLYISDKVMIFDGLFVESFTDVAVFTGEVNASAESQSLLEDQKTLHQHFGMCLLEPCMGHNS